MAGREEPLEIPDDAFLESEPLEAGEYRSRNRTDRRAVYAIGGVTVVVVLFFAVSLVLFGVSLSRKRARRAELARGYQPPAELADPFAGPPVPAGDPRIREIEGVYKALLADNVALTNETLLGNWGEKWMDERLRFLFDEWSDDESYTHIAALTDFEIHRCRFSNDGFAAVVYCRHHDADADETRVIWWLAKTNSGWRICDFADARVGLHVFEMMLTPAAQSGGFGRRASSTVSGPSAGDVSLVKEAAWLMMDHQYEDAGSKLDSVRSESLLLPPFRAAYWLMKAVESNEAADYQEAIDAADESLKLTDTPFAKLQRAIALSAVHRHEDAVRTISEFVSIAGPDERAYVIQGRALCAQGDDPRGLSLYRQALDADPSSLHALFQLGVALPGPDLKELTDRYAKSRKSLRHLNWLCWSFRDDERFDLAKAILDAHGGDFLTVHYHRAAVEFELGGDPQVAWTAVRQAYTLARSSGSEETRLETVEMFARIAERGDRLLEACNELQGSDRAAFFREALRSLQYSLYNPQKVQQLQALIAAHRKEAPHDVWLACAEAALEHQAGDHAAVVKRLRPRLAEVMDGEDFEQIRAHFCDSCVRSGAVLGVYRERPGPNIFRELGRALTERIAWGPHRATLSELIAAHRTGFPDDKNLNVLEAELLLADGKSAAAAELYKPLLETEDELVFDPASQYARLMYLAGKPIEAWRTLPDQESAFRELYSHLRSVERARNRPLTEQLIAEARQALPGNFEVAIGEIHLKLAGKDTASALEQCETLASADLDGAQQARLDYTRRLCQVEHALQDPASLKSVLTEENFIALARHLVYRLETAEARAAMQVIVDWGRENSVPALELAYVTAALDMESGSAAAAAGRLRPFAHSTDTADPSNITGFIRALYREAAIEAHQAAEAYRAAPDRKQAFSELLAEIVDTDLRTPEQRQMLRELLAEQKPDASPEHAPLLISCQAALLAADGDTAGALRELKSIRSDKDENYLVQQFTSLARRRLARNPASVVALHEQEGGNPAAFERVADLLTWSKDPPVDALAALIEAYAPRHPMDLQVTIHRAYLALWRKEPAATADLLWPIRTQLRTLDESRDWTNRAEDLLLESLLEAGRLADAETYVASMEILATDPETQVQMALARGDAQRAIELLDQALLDNELSLDNMYSDRLSKSLIARPELQAFRDEFPEPPPDPDDL